MLCPNCKKEIPDGTQFCTECGANTSGNVTPVQKKKPITKKWWFWVIIAVVVIAVIGIAGGGGASTDTSSDSDNAVVEQNDDTTKATDETTTVAAEKNSDGKYYVGDVLKCGDVEITFKSAEKWTGYNQYLPPEAGNMIVRLEFDVVNNGTSDFDISYFNFNGYADNQAVELYYNDGDLSATLSAGRNTSGFVCFEIPENTAVFEAEYELNLFTEEKAVFVVEF